MHNTKNGMITAKGAYDLIVSQNLPLTQTSLFAQLWHFSIPQKIKCFLWLVVENKINTWDNIVKKGWHGPNRCCLCKLNSETVRHLFVDCPFVQKTINLLCRVHLCSLAWEATSVVKNIDSWIRKKSNLLYLPFFFIWNLWKTRNYFIFEGRKPEPTSLCHLILQNVSAYTVPQDLEGLEILANPLASFTL